MMPFPVIARSGRACIKKVAACSASSSSGSALRESHILTPPGSWRRRPESRDGALRVGPQQGKQDFNTEDTEATGGHGEERFWGASRDCPSQYRAKRHAFLLRVLRWPPCPPCYSLTDLLAAPRARRRVGTGRSPSSSTCCSPSSSSGSTRGSQSARITPVRGDFPRPGVATDARVSPEHDVWRTTRRQRALA
jgi:hypothetical protein